MRTPSSKNITFKSRATVTKPGVAWKGEFRADWTAEVNADDPANIRVENRRYTEVTIPPSPWEPWP